MKGENKVMMLHSAYNIQLTTLNYSIEHIEHLEISCLKEETQETSQNKVNE